MIQPPIDALDVEAVDVGLQLLPGPASGAGPPDKRAENPGIEVPNWREHGVHQGRQDSEWHRLPGESAVGRPSMEHVFQRCGCCDDHWNPLPRGSGRYGTP
ncbi:MAG: hypothetical protein ACRDU4_06695, partial [Mycobacterium sp.]